MTANTIADQLRAATLTIGDWTLEYTPGAPDVSVGLITAFAKSPREPMILMGCVSALAVAMNPALLDAFISLMNAAFIAQVTPATHQTTLIENGGNDF